MSTSNERKKEITAASSVKTGANIARPRPVTVLDIVNKRVELLSTKKQFELCDKTERPPRYRAEFAVEGNLREYLKFQNQASGVKKNLSSLISFTSSSWSAGPDARAVPTSVYVREAWGPQGLQVLHAVDNALRKNVPGGEFASLKDWQLNIYITIKENNVYLKMEGARTAFARVLGQICWLVSVASHASIECLDKYIKETNQGKTTREYTETIYTGRPVIQRAESGRYFTVSFIGGGVERCGNHELLNKPGHCWKTMTGLSIVASGFTIPSRPRPGLGLEAPLYVLRQLISRGCHGKSSFAMEKPMVFFPPKTGSVSESGKAAQVYLLRLIYAVKCAKRPGEERNMIYWHFDPAKVCPSEKSFQQLVDGIHVDVSSVKSNSRHFVGWSTSAAHLTATRNELPLSRNPELVRCAHYELVLTGLTASLRASPVVTLGTTVAAEKVKVLTEIVEMYKTREQLLLGVSARYFVLWEQPLERGWLLTGDTVALHLLRVHLKNIPEHSNFDFSSFKKLGEGPSSARDVLGEFNAIPRGKKEDTATQEPNVRVGDILDGVYAALIQMSAQTVESSGRPALSGPILTWYERNWSASVRGWDFNAIARNDEVLIGTHKIGRDPGWLTWARELNATFLFSSGLGEIIKPKDGSCCPYFPTLPRGRNFLACSTTVIRKLIDQIGDNEVAYPPEKTVARLSRSHGWQRGLDPFARPRCQGDHLSTLDPSCFPVQGTDRATRPDVERKKMKHDARLLENNKNPFYTRKEVKDMVEKNPNGIVVFGRQPAPKELLAMCQHPAPNISQSGKQSVVDSNSNSTAVQSSDRPSSNGSPQNSTTAAPAPAPVPDTQKNLEGRPSLPSAKRTPSMASSKSSGSSAHAKASSGNGTGVAQPQASTSRSPAASVHKASSGISLRNLVSGSHPKPSPVIGTASGQLQSTASQSPSASMHKAASSASLRSNGSNLHPTASQGETSGNVPRSGQLELSASRKPAASVRQQASNASLRSARSTTASIAANGGAGRSQDPGTVSTAQTATRQSSNASIRTTSSVASRATNGSQPQRPSAQASDMGLRKTATNSSERTTGSQSSRVAQNLEAFNSNRQQQQLPLAHPTSSN